MYKIVKGADYGILPGRDPELAVKFQKMFQENRVNTSFYLEPGQYFFHRNDCLPCNFSFSNTTDYSAQRAAVILEGLTGCDLEAVGVTFMMNGQVLPIGIVNSRAVNIRGLTIDWEVPLSAEALITASEPGRIEVAIDSALYPYCVEEGILKFTGSGEVANIMPWSLVEFDTALMRVADGCTDNGCERAEDLGGGKVAIYGGFSRQPSVGNIMVLRHGERLHPGCFAEDSRELTLQDVTLHGSGGLGILCQFCRDLTFLRVQILPNVRAKRRFICSRDDGLHMSNNSGTIRVEECSFRGLMDDAINVHGTSARVDKLAGSRTIECLYIEKQSVGFSHWAVPGALMAFLDSRNLSPRGYCRVASYSLLSPERFSITFESEIPADLKVGDALENMDNTPSFICRNNYFGSSRARGILFSTPKTVLVENNIFESAGSAILMAGDANQWYETGACHDVTIKNNTFIACNRSYYQFCNGVISICPEIPQPEEEKPYHSNIHILENTFLMVDSPALYALSAENLTFLNNRLFTVAHYPSRKPPNERDMVRLEYCRNVEIGNNICVGDKNILEG